MHGLIQVAGVIDAAEAAMLVDCGVDWLGFPLRLPVNKEDLTEDGATDIIARIVPPNRGVLITYETVAEGIGAFCDKLGVRTVQLHGAVPPAELRTLRRMRPDLFVVKSLVVNGDNMRDLVALVEQGYPWVNMFITDTFNPANGAQGATGLLHDWDISAELVRVSPRPVMLAGGLTPGNVGAAVRAVRPAAVDAHTGLENAVGRKDRGKVTEFVRSARAAFAACRMGLPEPDRHSSA
jgi:phosphoribosylanthranilate isomerase